MKLLTTERNSREELRRILHQIRICVILLTVTMCCWANNGSYARETEIYLTKGDKTLRELFAEIEDNSEFIFLYNENTIDLVQKVTIDESRSTITKILDKVLNVKTVKYEIVDRQVILYKTALTLEPKNLQQSNRKQITGTVVDVGGEAIIGANIMEKGTTNGMITDIAGNFSMTVQNNATLQVSYIGYIRQEIVVGNQSHLQIVLKEDFLSMEEVIVIGYGVQKKALVTGATVNIQGDALQKMSTANPLTALQSMSPGVTIMQSNGQPGADYIINIRGLSTNGEARPLYVIDGVPSGNNGLNNMSVADIESIDILKDAASSAIYGARAANGVVLITTKQGKTGRAKVSYDAYFGKQYLNNKPDLLNAKEWMMIRDEITSNDNQIADDFQGKLPAKLYNDIMSGSWEGTDWIDAFYCEGAPTVNHSLNVTGGNEMSKFSIGYSYSSQDGIFGEAVQSNFTRNTFRVNSDHIIYKVRDLDVIKIGENINYSYRKSNGVNMSGIGDDNLMRGIMVASPLLPVYNDDGEYYDYYMRTADGWNIEPISNNPIGLATNSSSGLNLRKNYYLNASAYLEIQPVKNLKLKSLYSYRQNASSYRSANHAGKWGERAENVFWTVSQNAGSGYSWSFSNTLSYAFTKNNNNISVMIGQEIEKSGYGESVEASGRRNNFELGFDYDYVGNLMPAIELADRSTGGSPIGENALSSFFGRAEWNYNETYMATFSLRADGSSNFARGNRWGYFPAVSAGWIITNEPLMENISSWMNYLKLRVSWGQNGNASVRGFQYNSTFSWPNTARYYFGADKRTVSSGSAPGVLKNPDITWETSQQTNVGLDARFLANRLGLTFDFYIKETKDWLLEAPIAAAWGFSAPNVNGGDVRNSGVELSFSWNNRKGDFSYGVNLNGSYNKNEVLRIDNAEGIIHGPADVLANPITEIYRMQVGQPMGFFYGWVHDGIFQNQAEIDSYKSSDGTIIQPQAQPGDIRFKDLDDNGIIDIDDKTKIGCGWPIYRAGLTLNMGYKGFDFMVTASGAFGHQIIKSYRSFAGRHFENYTTDVFKRWQGEGTDNFYPRLTNGAHINYTNFSGLMIENGDYVKIQNITLGYDFKRLLPAMPFGQARVYFTIQNLFTITKYSGMDPEVGFGNWNDDTRTWVTGIDQGYYPSAKTYLTGIQVTF
ncbi:MAG: TonB-dependent receptor [Tannerellaceae bacterium]|nr:TonB-dependent receptor [Tannerellaceae bacterium]